VIKNCLIAFALIALVSANSYAQRHAQNPGGAGQGFDPVARMTEELQLDETQASQMTEIMRESRSQHRNLQSADHAELCAIRTETDEQVSDILTDEQYTRFVELRSEHQSRGGERNGRGRPGNRDRQRGPLDCSGQSLASNIEAESS